MTPSEFREDLDIHKTRMNGLSCGEESMTIGYVQPFWYTIPACDGRMDGRTDGLTDERPAYSYNVRQLLTHVKNCLALAIEKPGLQS